MGEELIRKGDTGIRKLSAGLKSHLSGRLRRPRPHLVIHSDVVPLENDYVLFQISGQSSGFKLSVENGRRVDPKVLISLYNNGQLVQKEPLKRRLDWDLESLDPGSYKLKFNEKIGLQFKIE